MLASLTDVLRETFPVVCRLIGEPFFAFAAREFIAAHPPLRPSLSDYGDAFPAFLGTFPPCSDIAYLADTARLEWLLTWRATPPMSRRSPRAVFPRRQRKTPHGLYFDFIRRADISASVWPVDRIWRANQPESQDQSVDLDAGGTRLEVSRGDDGVVFRTLDEAEFGFRKSLAGGAPLGVALERALCMSPHFPAPDALAVLFHAGLVVAVTRSSSAKEHAP